MPFCRPSTLVLASALLVASVQGLFSDGTISGRDWLIQYSGYDGTLAFCTAFRDECITYVGDLDYHHQLDCVVTQPGPQIYAICGGKLKTADGDTGTGPTIDFTTEVCPQVSGCKTVKNPTAPVQAYGAAAPVVAATTPSPAAVVAHTSETVTATSVKGAAVNAVTTTAKPLANAGSSTASAVAAVTDAGSKVSSVAASISKVLNSTTAGILGNSSRASSSSSSTSASTTLTSTSSSASTSATTSAQGSGALVFKAPKVAVALAVLVTVRFALL